MPDANVLIGWLFDRSAPYEFVDRLTTADDVLAAQVLLPECTSTLRAAVFDGRLEAREAREMLARLVDFPAQRVDSPQQFALAFDFAARFRHRRAYDMQYLAVAARQDAELVTMDGGMRHAAENAGV
ncbi:MAG TPA: type II toxin-antitoxin system VapC family toxin, partial [Dehalococcoidia bacterium]|nr:type II toxin-antitoxin system VapC family toxin [Dehalococcoidia bacterium]